MRDFVINEIQKLSTILTLIQEDNALLATVESIANVCTKTLQQGGKILFAGNGGSAADSQHLAAELVVRLKENRPGLSAIALTTDTSILTAIGNDFSFEHIFSRQVETLGCAGDVFIAFSTSGKSPNILRALNAAKQKQIITVGFSGQSSPQMAAICDWVLNVPAIETPKIQECHILFGHIICALIEEQIFGLQKQMPT